MAENGRKMIMEEYNWNIEKEKLYNLYNSMLY